MTNSEDILTGLMRWVEIDTPTGATETIGTLIDLIAADLEPLGAALERVPGRDGMGDHLIARFAGANGPGVLITSHIDTVCPPGAVTIRRDGDRQYGPGIADMKGGGYLAFSAVRNLLASGAPLPGPVTLIYNSDEEIGSPTSHALIQAEAKKHGAALIPEPARGDEVITFRKGRAKYTLDIFGTEAHAGSAFANGRSAISELARVIVRLDALTDLSAGTTVNVGRIRGGSEPNVVAGHAACDVDVRFAKDEARRRHRRHAPRHDLEGSRDADRGVGRDRKARSCAHQGDAVDVRNGPRLQRRSRLRSGRDQLRRRQRRQFHLGRRRAHPRRVGCDRQ
nr:M20/M25/M40 family metallo-hydrolase [Jiella pelagia]